MIQLSSDGTGLWRRRADTNAMDTEGPALEDRVVVNDQRTFPLVRTERCSRIIRLQPDCAGSCRNTSDISAIEAPA
jgi:hypothetical protein